MMRRAINSLLVRLSVCILVGGALSGCATPGDTTSRDDLMRQHFGIRPDEPKIVIQSNQRDCSEYLTYVSYSQQLMEAYHSRATQNRGWIYVAGITGLGITAASGGLAAAAAVGVGTLGLLSISGGFAVG